jgi:hypothetical protein
LKYALLNKAIRSSSFCCIEKTTQKATEERKTIMRTPENWIRVLIALAMVLTFSVVGTSSAVAQTVDSATYLFVACTNNRAANVTTGEEQLSIVVSLLTNGNISFRFQNSGPNASSITDVYFYDPADELLTPMLISGSSGVDFSEGAAPGNLPGRRECPGLNGTGSLAFTSHDDADSNPAVQPNGVNPGEWLIVEMDLASWLSFDDIVAGLSSGQIRVGIHVQGFSPNGSESFVNLGDPETYVQLDSFGVEVVEGGVAVRWVTAAEIDNVGFNVYRAATVNGPFVKVNDVLIGALGNGTGAEYELVDADGEAGDVYRLEDIDYDGTRTMHLPAAAEAVLDTFVFLPIIQGNVVVR